MIRFDLQWKYGKSMLEMLSTQSNDILHHTPYTQARARILRSIHSNDDDDSDNDDDDDDGSNNTQNK